MTLTQSELDSCDYNKGDTEGFVNYGLTLNGVIFSCIMIENESEGKIKMSFRSQGIFSAGAMDRGLTEGVFRPRWMLRRIAFTLGWLRR